ncbi:MAG: pyridoxal phosphate-dependent aminotransferase [Gemmatimonadales bacterium]
MPDPLSQNLVHLKASETVAISAEAKRRKAAGEDVLDLGVGEPDFDTPAAVAEAGIRAIQRSMTRYPPNAGIPELRTAIARNLSLLSGGRAINPDHIIVSSGSKQALFNACFSLFGPKDKVLIPAPAWVSYPQIVQLARAEPILVPGDVEWGLKVSVADLDRHTDRLVRGLILCSPCNPTGSVYTLSELKAIAEWARKNDVWLIADEIYRRINYGTGPAPSVLDLPEELLERTVVICGASKAYAMTGWRIGAALAPPHLVKAMAGLQTHTTTGANHPAQWAAVAAFSEPKVEPDVRRMVAAFRARRDTVVERFRTDVPGVEYVEPHGAFYFFFRVDGIAPANPIGGAAFCQQLMQEEGVALVPGSAFGDDRWVRLSYAVSDRELDEALTRVIRFIKHLASARAA